MNENITFAGNRTAMKTKRLDIRQGFLSQYIGPDQPRKEYNYAEGQLEGIAIRSHETPGGEINFLDLHFRNGNAQFIISSIACSSVSADLVSRLANIKDPKSMIRIDVWPKDSFTNCSVRENGEKVPFTTLPKAIKVQNGLKMIIDSTDRDAAVLKLIKDINSRLGYEKN